MVMPIAGGIGLATRTDGRPDSPSTPDTYFQDLIRDSAQRAWADYRPKLESTLHDQLGRGDLITSGVTLYDIDIRVAQDTDLSVERDDSGDLIVHITTGGSSITATSTTPTDLGSWADPRFSFDFGLELTYRIDLPPTTQPLSATGFQSIHVLSPRLDSQNFVADVVFMINDIVDWFSGTDFIGMLETFIASTDFAPYVQDSLQPLNDELTRLAGQGYWFLDAVVDRLDGGSGDLHGLSLPGAPSGKLDLLLTAYGFDLSGAVEGLISWPKALGQPTNRPKLQGAVIGIRDVAASSLAMATMAAIQEPRTSTWVDVMASPGAVLHQPAAPTGDDDQSPAQAADLAFASGLEAIAPAERAVAAQEARAGVADRFVSLIGGADRFAALRAEFLRGREDFVVSVTVPVGGEGIAPDMRAVGTLSYLWADDDDTTYRRRYLVVDLPIDAALTVTSDLAPGYRWEGSVTQVACERSGWAGTVTVHHAPARVPLTQAFAEQVEVQRADHTRIIGSPTELEERGIIIVSGRTATSDISAVSLNPQPLPPRERSIQVGQVAHLRESIQAAGASTQITTPVAESAIHGGAQLATALAGGSVLDDVVSLQSDHSAAIAAAAATFVRDNPTGKGTVRGIDFRVAEYHPPIVR